MIVYTFLKDKKALVGHIKINQKDRYIMQKERSLSNALSHGGPFAALGLFNNIKQEHLTIYKRTKSINQTSVHVFQDQSCKAKWFVGATKQFEYIIALFREYLSILVVQIRILLLLMEPQRKICYWDFFSFHLQCTSRES